MLQYPLLNENDPPIGSRGATSGCQMVSVKENLSLDEKPLLSRALAGISELPPAGWGKAVTEVTKVSTGKAELRGLDTPVTSLLQHLEAM